MIFYWLSLALAVGALALVYGLLRSRVGLALTAIRDSEPASRSVSVDAFRAKLMTFVVVAFCTGLAGGLIFLIGPYQVGPYAEGPYEVAVPLSAFQSLLAPAYADEFAGGPAKAP